VTSTVFANNSARLQVTRPQPLDVAAPHTHTCRRRRQGGAISISKSGSIDIDRCKFINSTANTGTLARGIPDE
jgi:hypothetical protein